MPIFASEPGAAPSCRPSLLVVLADQLRPCSTGFGGEATVRTPILDGFAAEGVSFTSAISNTPLCAPFRGCLLTGQYAHCHGVIANDLRLPDDAVTLGEVLMRAGYNTGYVGKWHLGGARRGQYEPPGPGRHGFDYWSAYEFNHDHNRNLYYEDGPEPICADGYQMDSETERAIRYIERQEGERPFGLILSWGPPHPPYEPWNMPADYLGRYGDVEDLQPDKASGPWQPWQRPVRLTPRPLTPARLNATGGWDRMAAAYYAMIDWLDACLGRVLAALERTGHAGNTIVVFTSDHGEMLGSHNTRGKMIFYEESVRIPLLVRWPGRIAPRTTCDACISSVDFLPTVLGLLGIDCPPGVQGMDLSHCALGRSGPEPSGAIIASYTGYSGFNPGWEYRGVRTKRYTYARSLVQLQRGYTGWQRGDSYRREPERFLFDNSTDPYQLQNLADGREYREIREALDAHLAAYQHETEDLFLPAQEYAARYDADRLRVSVAAQDRMHS